MSFYRILLSQQMEANLCLHWLIGEWISCQLCLSNRTQSLPLSVYRYSLCNLASCVFFFLLDCTQCSFQMCFFLWLSQVSWVILALLFPFRTWDCPQQEAGVGVKTHPVTTCIRIGTNLQCALNVAVSWPRRTPREQRWKFVFWFSWSADTVRLVSSCISDSLTSSLSLSTTLDLWAVSS